MNSKEAKYFKSRLFKIKFIHLIHKGLTVQEIAEECGVTVCAARERAKSYGLKPMGAIEKRRLQNRDTVDEDNAWPEEG